MRFREFLDFLNETISLKRKLYRGTVEGADLQSTGRDYGDWGLGVYLATSPTVAISYAYAAAKKTGKKPIILVIEHTLKNPANFDDEEFKKSFFDSIGVPAEKAITPGMAQSRPQQDSQKITQELMKLGYDSAVARHGSEVVAFDPSQLKIIEQRTPEEAGYLT
jgi:hypothetical protein